MSFLVATTVVASRPPERWPTGTLHACAKNIAVMPIQQFQISIYDFVINPIWRKQTCFDNQIIFPCFPNNFGQQKLRPPKIWVWKVWSKSGQQKLRLFRYGQMPPVHMYVTETRFKVLSKSNQ